MRPTSDQKQAARRFKYLVKFFSSAIDGPQVGPDDNAVSDGIELKTAGIEFDPPDKIYEGVKAICPSFSWGVYGHRIFLHWGGNINLVRHVKLTELISDGIRREAQNDERIMDSLQYKRDAILSYLESIRSQRNDDLEADVLTQLSESPNGSFLLPDHVTAITVLLYDTHLLGDYIEGYLTAREAIIGLDELIGEIENAVRRIQGDETLTTNFCSEMESLRYHLINPIRPGKVRSVPPVSNQTPWYLARSLAVRQMPLGSIRAIMDEVEPSYADEQIIACATWALMVRFVPRIIDTSNGGYLRKP